MQAVLYHTRIRSHSVDELASSELGISDCLITFCHVIYLALIIYICQIGIIIAHTEHYLIL